MFVIGSILATVLTLFIVLKFLYPPLWKDLQTLKRMLHFMGNLKKAYKKRELIIDRFEQHVKSRPDKVFLYYKDEQYTYKQADDFATRAAHALTKNGVSRNDTVTLIMSNEPAFMWIYFGTQKLGARLAMINHHLLAEGLQRSIDACFPKIIIIGDGIMDYLPSRVISIKSNLQTNAPMFTYNPSREDVSLPCFSQLMEEASLDPIDPSVRSQVKLTDPSLFIYTSGTTGFPKPAIIAHKKSILCSLTYAPVGFSSKDVLYLVLPLYHAAAINLSVLNVIQEGASLVLRDKFSASNFWQDCVKYKVTIVQYIGELFRYLTNTPECPEEKQHQVWALAGNGLRLDVWRDIKKRFQIKNIFEFYGSTEFPGGITNYLGQEGSVGRLSPLLSRLLGHILVDVDESTQQPFRDANGRCRKTKPGGAGLFIARLSQKVTFEGYLGAPALTNNRILKDVFHEGDSYVNSSDVFYMDKEYNLYFKDRLGDLYRWKGENVSTTEVSSVLNDVDFIQDANVYGVSVAGCEGKAGMAAITLKDGLTLNDEMIGELGRRCRDNMPPYARPRFLRFQSQMNLTSTFKQLKTNLIKEGFDVNTIQGEPVYYLDRKSDSYQLLDSKGYDKIISGQIAL